jgi:NAD(P)-dependent dehydrogenase (short-subunit alcohol dehydrogenase family)
LGVQRRTLVVGGDGGIGRACVEQFSAMGSEILVIDRSRGHDAADPRSVSSALAGVESVTDVVHAAGSVGSGGIEEISVEDWNRVVSDNLTSAFVVCQQVLPLMPRGGSIVLLSSVNGRHGGNRLSGPAYATAKAGLIGLTRHLAKDQAPRGIRVNAIAPGPVSSPMLDRLSEEQLDALIAHVPLGHVAVPDEVAGTAAWLCSDAAQSVTGAVIDLNGGMWMG